MDYRLPTRNPWNWTIQICDKCGYGHFNKPCTSKLKTKSAKKAVRDKERIQTFHNKAMLLKEMPFANLRNAAFKNCMHLNEALKTELSKTKAKVKNISESNFSTVTRLENELQNCIHENSTLKQQVLDLQNQLTAAQSSNNEVQSLKNKVSSLKTELETAKLCFREENKRINENLVFCEKEKQLCIEKLAFEIAEKLRCQNQNANDQEHIRVLEYKLDDMEETLRSIPPPCQCYAVQQNSCPLNPVPTYPTDQHSISFPCQPLNMIPQQPPLPPNRQNRRRRSKRGGFF